MNLLMVNPFLAIFDLAQTPLIRELEKHSVDVIPLQIRHARTLGGEFHCVTLDVRRTGSLKSYWLILVMGDRLLEVQSQNGIGIFRRCLF